MRPPRAISGSSSAAAAAAVALAMATVANARVSALNFPGGFEGSPEDTGHGGSPRSMLAEDRHRFSSIRTDDYQLPGLYKPMLRRASASARVVDDGSSVFDHSRPRRKLQSYSSSPSSLRNSFLTSGSSRRTSTPALPTAYRHSNASPSLNRIPPSSTNSNIIGNGRDSFSDTRGLNGFNYVGLPTIQSTSSTSASSPLTCVSLSRSVMDSSDDSKASPTAHSWPSSLPPTPTHASFEKSSEGCPVSPTSREGLIASYHPQSIQSSHRLHSPALYRLLPRTSTASPYLPPQFSDTSTQSISSFDRRSSLPLNALSASQARTHDAQAHLSNIQQGREIMQSVLNSQNLSKDASPTQPHPQPSLMRSNSMPAIFNTISRPIGHPDKDNPSLGGLHGSRTRPLSYHHEPSPDAPPRVVAKEIPFWHPLQSRSEVPGHPLDPSNHPHFHLANQMQPSLMQQGPTCPGVSGREQDGIGNQWNLVNSDSLGHPLNTNQHASAASLGIQQQQQQQQYQQHYPSAQQTQTYSYQSTSQAMDRRQSYQASPLGNISQELNVQLQQQQQQQHQQLKVEQMDNEAFDSSLAMVLDDHLSLMDHLNLIPDVNSYSSELPMAPPMQPFKQDVLPANAAFHDSVPDSSSSLPSSLPSSSSFTTSYSFSSPSASSSASQMHSHLGPTGDTCHNDMATSSSFYADFAGSPRDDVVIKQEEGTRNDPMIYFANTFTAIPPPTASCDTHRSAFQGPLIPTKVEPGIQQPDIQQSQAQQSQAQAQGQSHPDKSLLEQQQHPLDTSPMYHSTDRSSLMQDAPVLVTEFSYRTQHHFQQQL
ncbi:hypothetical protein BGZ51_003745 [Haplosporangium sp. Z 767]|nr:hypothetical protein BGZ51_003745 [Haplosporangium sp. Z 767]